MHRYLLVFLFLLFAHTALAGPFEDGQDAFGRKDFVTASKLWEPLAEQGDVKAQLALGRLNDISSSYAGRNINQALKWYLMAAQQGNAEAQAAAANLYMSGVVAKDNYTEAAKWARLAAEQGDRSAYDTLAKIYQYGYGTPRDVTEAYFWQKLMVEESAGQDHKFALVMLQADGKPLSPEQKTEIDGKVDEWLKKHPATQGDVTGNYPKQSYKPDPQFENAFGLTWGTLMLAPIVGFVSSYLIRRRWPTIQSSAAKGAGIIFVLLVGFFEVLHFSFTDFSINFLGFIIGYFVYCFLAASCRLIPNKVVRFIARIVTIAPIVFGYILGTLASPRRAIPWVTGGFNYEISGGLEPGETADWNLQPNTFGDWKNGIDAPKDAVLTVDVVCIDGADGKPIADIRGE